MKKKFYTLAILTALALGLSIANFIMTLALTDQVRLLYGLYEAVLDSLL